MKYYSKCPVCGSKPSFSIREKISLNKDSTIGKIEIEEFLIKVSKEKSPEEVLSVCMKCRLVYREKFFDDKELEEIYNEVYYRMEERISAFAGFLYNDEKFRNESSKRIYETVKDIEKRYQTEIVDIYDIGGRDGFMMKDLAENGYKCTVFDPIPRESCHDKILKKSIWLSQIESNQAADMVFLCDVLAHCINPQEELIRCYEMLRNEGFLYIEVPHDMESVFNWLLLNKWRGKNLGIDLTHFIFFSLRSLAYLLEESGFRYVKMYFNRLPNLNITSVTILARKAHSEIQRSPKSLSFDFDLLKSGYFVQLTKRVFNKINARLSF